MKTIEELKKELEEVKLKERELWKIFKEQEEKLTPLRDAWLIPFRRKEQLEAAISCLEIIDNT